MNSENHKISSSWAVDMSCVFCNVTKRFIKIVTKRVWSFPKGTSMKAKSASFTCPEVWFQEEC